MTSDFKPKRTEQSQRPQLSTEEWMAKKQAEKEEEVQAVQMSLFDLM